MHVNLARIVTPTAAYHPATAFENTDSHEVYLDTKGGTRIRTMMNASVEMADEEIRLDYGVDRLWIVRGWVDGHPETWAVMPGRGCGCGSTGQTEPTEQQAALLERVTVAQ